MVLSFDELLILACAIGTQIDKNTDRLSALYEEHDSYMPEDTDNRRQVRESIDRQDNYITHLTQLRHKIIEEIETRKKHFVKY